MSTWEDQAWADIKGYAGDAYDLGKIVFGSLGNTVAQDGGGAEGYFRAIAGDVNKWITTAAQDIGKLVNPIVGDIKTISDLAQNINDHLIQPILAPIKEAISVAHTLKTEFHADLSTGLSGLIRMPGQVANALTSVDSVLARSNQQLGEDQTIIAQAVLAPAMQDSGILPAAVEQYRIGVQSALTQGKLADFPPVDVTGPTSFAEYKRWVDDISEWILKPGEFQKHLLDQSAENLSHFVTLAKPDIAELIAGMGKGLEAVGDELMLPIVEVLHGIFYVYLAAEAIDVKFEQQKDLWRQDLRATTPTELLGVETLILAQRRGIVSEEERIAQGLKTGMDPSRQKVLYEMSTWLIPAAVAIDWYARGYIDADQRDEILKWNNVAPDDRDRLIRGSYALANPREWMAVLNRQEAAAANYFPDSIGTEIPGAIADQYARVKIEASQGALDWTEHWKFPPVAWWLKAYFRGIRTYSEMTTAARMENIPPDILGDLIGVEQETIQQWMLPDIVGAGVVGDAEFRRYAYFIGMEPQSTELLLAWGHTKLKQPIAAQYADLVKVTLSTATTLYEAGTVDRQVLLDVFLAHGYSAEAAELTAEGIDLKAEAKARAAALETLAAEVDLGDRTEQSALDAAYQDSYTAREIEKLTALIHHKKQVKSRLPSEAQLNKMVGQKLLTTLEYVGGLELLGYNPTWARLIAASELGIPLTELEAQL